MNRSNTRTRRSLIGLPRPLRRVFEIREIERRAQTSGELLRVFVCPEVHEVESRVFVDHVAVERRDFNAFWVLANIVDVQTIGEPGFSDEIAGVSAIGFQFGVRTGCLTVPADLIQGTDRIVSERRDARTDDQSISEWV
jgi:hypothetical protein